MTEKKIDPPMIIKKKGNLLYWPYWSGGEYWSYPFSVDGNIYARRELLFLINHVDFHGPNSFEANMNRYRFVMRLKFGVCFKKSVLFNNPANRVQFELPNKCGVISPYLLLDKFNKGYEIDFEAHDSINNNSPHYEASITFKKRIE